MSQPRILIVGGGAFGTSAAYHLSLRGYHSVTVLDRHPPPSMNAAATDLNKIVRHDYPNPLYTRLGLEPKSVWKDPDALFAGMLRPTGWIMAAYEMTQGFLDATYRNGIQSKPASVRYMGVPEIKHQWPEFTGDFEGWTISSKVGCFKGFGYMEQSMADMAGILFPPDENGLLKLCSCRFITNYFNSHVPGASLGHSLQKHPGDGVPRQIGEEMRSFVRDMIPELADRPWVSTRMCRDGDTKDVNFRICPYPNTKNLYIATAGSGHGFKFMPIIGRYIADMVEGKLQREYAELWKWRYGEAPPKTGKEPHPWPERDLGQLDG